MKNATGFNSPIGRMVSVAIMTTDVYKNKGVNVEKVPCRATYPRGNIGYVNVRGSMYATTNNP